MPTTAGTPPASRSMMQRWTKKSEDWSTSSCAFRSFSSAEGELGMPITRRTFIKRAAGAVTVGVILPKYVTRAAKLTSASPQSSRRLVIVQLVGGNDGLNTVVPYSDSRYHALRP